MRSPIEAGIVPVRELKLRSTLASVDGKVGILPVSLLLLRDKEVSLDDPMEDGIVPVRALLLNCQS